MAERLEIDGGQTEAPPRRPLWLAALAALLTAVFAALSGIMMVDAYFDAQIPVFCDHCIRSPAPLTFAWWAYVAPFLPYIASGAVAYAASLLAITAYPERRPARRRLPWPLAGVLAMAPLACFWVVMGIIKPPYDPAMAFSLLFAILAVIGLIGGAVAGAVRR